MDSEELRKQILNEMERLHSLIVRYALGDYSVKHERDTLDEEIQVKMIQWRCLQPSKSF